MKSFSNKDKHTLSCEHSSCGICWTDDGEMDVESFDGDEMDVESFGDDEINEDLIGGDKCVPSN